MICEEFVEALSTAVRPSPALAEHAASCAACRSLWLADEGLRARTAAAVGPLSPSPELAAVLAQHHGPTRSWRAGRAMLLVFAATAAWVVIGLLFAPRIDLARAAQSAAWLPLLASVLIMAAGVQLYLHRGPTGFGAPVWQGWLFVLGGIVTFEAIATLQVALAPDDPVAHAPIPRDCLFWGLAVAACVGSVAFAVRRRTALIAPASLGGLAGCVAGLAAIVFLHVHCGATDLRHLRIAHVLPLLIAILVGTLAGRRVLSA